MEPVTEVGWIGPRCVGKDCRIGIDVCFIPYLRGVRESVLANEHQLLSIPGMRSP